jgi:L-lactate dehydrogenase (cytochrome)
LIFDSGVRDGEDIVKALAMGADFVMLGRPFLYAAGAAGALGVERMVELLVEETHATLAQIGCRDINSLDATVLSQKP